MLSSTFRGDDHSMNDFFHHGKLHWLLAHSKWTSIARMELAEFNARFREISKFRDYSNLNVHY